VGRRESPLAFAPTSYLPDPRAGRFDDPLKEFGVLYCARSQSTALRETLQHFAHTTAVLTELQAIYGNDELPLPKVPTKWRERRVLSPARIRLSPGTSLIAYENPQLVRQLQNGAAGFLRDHNVLQLDIPALGSKDRIVSQFLSRLIYDQGYAGILFRSRFPPGGTCVALFEGRAWLQPNGESRELSRALPALRKACRELALEL
jgi:RES domain